MTISSVIVQTKPEFTTKLINNLKESNLCEFHLQDEKGRIVITIEGNTVGQEVEKLMAIQKMEYVISAEMVYSHSEDELDKLRQDIENAPVSEWLNDENADIKNKKYSGDLHKKF